ncbi:uncharacterized protein [Watersipora subatra]|uniref:uncharacterized protein n=1 Tax=Watersipora subatra TaxID=2589382 RepID=UPI00355C674C
MLLYDKNGYIAGIQAGTGPTPADLMTIPMDEEMVIPQTNFVQGKCFYMMGMHYWYDIAPKLDCKDIFPVFLLYNKKRLNGFGWAFNPNYNNSAKWEHPTRDKFSMFMKPVPPCLGVDGPTTTLHIYMTDSPRLNLC